MIDLSRMLGRFRADADGNATVEFVIIFPLMFLWLSYSFLFFDAFRSNSLTEKVAFTVADIMSRHDAVDGTDLAYLVAMQNKMLPPRVDQRRTRITSICFEDNAYKVLWSHAAANDDYTADWDELTDETIPLALMPTLANQDSVILAEVYGRWKPLTDWGGLKPQDYVNRLVVRPRYVQIIPHEQLNDSTVCPREIS